MAGAGESDAPPSPQPSFITGVLGSHYKGSSFAIAVPSPSPRINCYADASSCGPVEPSFIGSVSRNSVALKTNLTLCTASKHCYLFGGSLTPVVAPPPPPADLTPTSGSVATAIHGTCTSADACFVHCSASISTSGVYGTSGGNFGVRSGSPSGRPRVALGVAHALVQDNATSPTLPSVARASREAHALPSRTGRLLPRERWCCPFWLRVPGCLHKRIQPEQGAPRRAWRSDSRGRVRSSAMVVQRPPLC